VTRVSVSCAAAALAALLAASGVGAQPPSPPAWYVPLELDSDDPGLRFGIARSAREEPFAWCQGTCGMWLPPGRYVIEVPEAPGLLGGKRRFTLEEPSRGRVTPRSQARRTGALIMGGVGSALAATGLVIMMTDPGLPSDSFGLALLFLVPGAILAPIGWARAGSSPALELEPMEAPLTAHRLGQLPRF
jgi:hypothetical protein